MASFALNDIPGYREALATARRQMSETRENAWLALPETIGGFTVRLMTVADYALLDRQRSPFLYRLAPTLDDLKIFLWVLSPSYGRWLFGGDWRRQFPTVEAAVAFLYGQRIQRRLGRNLPESAEAAAVACFKYVDKLFLDAPPQAKNNGPSSGCFLAGWFDALQTEHKLTSEEIWRMPLPQMFQRLKAITQRHRQDVPDFNRFEDQLNGFVLRGLVRKEFTQEDLLAGKVKLPDAFGNN